MTKFEHAQHYTMEKAILKTLIYADIFDYPLKGYEIHKWLIGRRATLRQVEKALIKLNKELRIKNKAGYYFLPRQDRLIAKRRRRETQSVKFLRKAQLLTIILKVIPWIKLVGISGGLAMENAQKSDDIDLFIITAKKRLWISRLLALGLLSLAGQRRKKGEMGRKIAGKLCVNVLLEEDQLEQTSKDIYLAHEVLQMKVLWQRDGIYSKYLEDNSWAFKFLPNWIGDNFGRPPHSLALQRQRPVVAKATSDTLADARLGLAAFGGSLPALSNLLEILARRLQLKIMGKPQGLERIEEGALFFHPLDCRSRILDVYKKKVANLSTP